MDKTASIIRITLRSQPSKAVTASGHNLPDDVRLANLLKYAGRACGYKCINIEKIEDGETPKT